MNRWLLLSGGFLSALLLSAGLAVGQTQPKASADCVHKSAPQKVEGQVVAVAPDGKMTVKDKAGDQIEAKLSEGQKKC